MKTGGRRQETEIRSQRSPIWILLYVLLLGLAMVLFDFWLLAPGFCHLTSDFLDLCSVTVGTDSVTEMNAGMGRYILFELLPVIVIVADFLAIAANRQ
jgi:hypothetical protein